MTDEPKNGTPLGEPDPRLMPTIEVKVIIRNGQCEVKGNVPPDVCLQVLKDGIVAVARIGWKPAEQSLVMPASNIRKLPHP